MSRHQRRDLSGQETTNTPYDLLVGVHSMWHSIGPHPGIHGNSHALSSILTLVHAGQRYRAER